MAASRAGFVQFPEEILTKVFSLLNMEDLLQAAAVCKAWQQVASSEALWESICRQRWRLWTKLSTSAAGGSQHWRQTCQRRVELDRSARRLVAEMAWPLQRHNCFREVVALGDQVVEELERLSSRQGDQEEGTRFFASKSLQRISQTNCIIAMKELLATPLPQLEDCLARGALLIAKLRYQDLDVEVVESRIGDWKDILLQRLRRDADVARFGGLSTSAGALAGLKQLNALLFGDVRAPPPGEDADSQGTLSSDPLVDVNVFRQCMNLRANVEDYYNPSNLYLNDVLDSRKGVEISLAIIHYTIGRRCNIPVHIVAIPMRFVTKVGEEGEADERFVDVFNSGRLLLRSECIDLIQEMGLDIETERLAPVPPSRIFYTICDNLYAIYQQGDGELDARRQPKERHWMQLPLLDLLLAITPEDCSHRFNRVKLLLEMSDFEAVLDDLQALLQLIGNGLNAQDGPITRALLQQYLENAQEKRELHAAWCSERRTPRPADVLYKVGNVVRHVRFQYPGVIFGWDKVFSLDEEWITAMRIDQLQYGRSQPFYHVLVDQNFWNQNFRNTSMYVAQENIVLAPDAGHILHRDLGMHFLGYRNGRYILNDYLSHIYPEDLLEELQLPVEGVEKEGQGADVGTVPIAASSPTAPSSAESLPDPLLSLPPETEEGSSKLRPSE
ncbi:unnamed protein product [Calypogeia fissa]